jgi:hypothetical protein
MARARHTQIEKDFVEVFQFLSERLALSAKVPLTLQSTAKRIHQYTYSLITWKFRLGKMPTRGRVYIEEIASDALQILPQVLAGYSKTPKLLMRGIIENTLRHIYFYDHPIEFTRTNKAGKWHVTIASMFDFLGAHPEFILTEPKFGALARLSNLYVELSAGVHGRSVRDLETRSALRAIKYDQIKAEQDADLLAKCTTSVNFLLAIFHHEKVWTFPLADRRMILHTMPTEARKAWKEHESPDEMREARA